MKKIFIDCVLLIVILVISSPAKTVDEQIMQYLFNAQLSQADSLINLQIRNNPDDPKNYFLKAHYDFYMRYFTNRNVPRDSILQEIINNAWKAVNTGKKQSETTGGNFIIGSSYGLLARAYIMRENLWDGFWAGRDCLNYLEQVLDEDPSFYDARLGIGVIRYFTARLTGIQAFFAWLGGMSGEVEEGLADFKITASKGKLLKHEATFILATMYRYLENDLDQANIYLTELKNNFPDNRFITNLYEQTHLVKIIEDKGIEYLKAGIDSLKVRYHIENSFVLNNIGYFYVSKQQYNLAVPVFKLNIELYPDEANPYDSIAECYQIQGDFKNAIRYSRIAMQKLPEDKTLDEAFRERLKNILETRLKDLGEDGKSKLL